MLGRLAAHFSRYSLASLLVTAASLVSFPILTRVFSVAEYGLLSLLGVVLTLLAAVGKLGLQHAALRFYSEIRAGASAFTMRQYEATVVVGLTVAGLSTALVWLVVGRSLPETLWNDDRVRPLIALIAALALLQCISSAFVNQLRARELSGALSLYSVGRRYLDLGLMLVTLLYIARDLRGFWTAVLAAELIATAVLAVWFLRRFPCRISDTSAPLMRAMLIFGFPLILSELSSVMLSLGDRFVIQHLLGAEALGVYAAPYNLCEYISAVLVVAFTGAVHPMMLRLWSERGPDETRVFLGEVTHIYLLFAIPLVAGLSAVGEPMLAVFASDKFRDGAAVIPWVIAGLALQGLFPVAAAGLHIRKRSGVILAALLTATAVNLALNLLLVPLWGIVGAAVATLAAYALMTALALHLGRDTLAVQLHGVRILKFAGAALLMYVVVTAIRLPSDVATLMVRLAAGVLAYPLALLAIDSESRRMLAGVRARLGFEGGAP